MHNFIIDNINKKNSLFKFEFHFYFHRLIDVKDFSSYLLLLLFYRFIQLHRGNQALTAIIFSPETTVEKIIFSTLEKNEF
jgi:hypothetical protein